MSLGVIADAANDSDDGKLNILGIFHAVQTAEVPYSHPLMSIVLMILAEEEKGTDVELDIIIRDPIGDETAGSEHIFLPIQKDSPVGTAEHSIVLTTTNTTFYRYGRYHFLIRLNIEVKREIYLFILPTGQSIQSSTAW